MEWFHFKWDCKLNDPFGFLQYLDALDKVDSTGRYDGKLVYLYAKYCRQKLLTFLKRSNSYPIEDALRICAQQLFYPEMVYLNGHMGNTIDALSIIITKLNDIQMAIDFCKEHDDMDLWNELINQSLDRPEIMTKLLDGIAGLCLSCDIHDESIQIRFYFSFDRFHKSRNISGQNQNGPMYTRTEGITGEDALRPSIASIHTRRL